MSQGLNYDSIRTIVGYFGHYSSYKQFNPDLVQLPDDHT